MDVRVHEKILWHACDLSRKRTSNLLQDPRKYLPLMALGTFRLDYRQATILMDIVKQGLDAPRKARIDSARASSEMIAVLRTLWAHTGNDLLLRMQTTWAVDASVVADAKKLVEHAGRLDGLGSYSAFDHLDVLDSTEKFAKAEEDYFHHEGKALGRSKSVDHTMNGSLKFRLTNALAPVNGDPFAWQPMADFGEVLHIVSDFYAHTNYVELFLWELASRGHIRQSIIDAFNEVPEVQPGEPFGVLCPLPEPGGVQTKTAANTMFCYRESAAQTPLVSSLFVLDDTAQSLLRRFADHLLVLERELTKEEFEKNLDEQLDLMMAVFDMSSTRVMGEVRKQFVAVKSALRELGREVRVFVANRLRSLGNTLVGAERDRCLFAANLLEGQSLKEAGQWAKAGKYRYVAYSIERRLAKELDYGATSVASRTFRLPHHSLLRKDKDEHDVVVTTPVPHLLRYKLACLLAIDTVAQLIEWRMSAPKPDRAVAMGILERKARHPSIQLAEIHASAGGDERLAQLGDLITDIQSGSWETFVKNQSLMGRFLEVSP